MTLLFIDGFDHFTHEEMMNKYVLINKITGKYFPNTSNLQEADVLRRDAFTLPNACFTPIMVEYDVKIKLSKEPQDRFVQISERNGEYIAGACSDKQTTTDLQGAAVYIMRDSIRNVLSLPVVLERKNIKIV